MRHLKLTLLFFSIIALLSSCKVQNSSTTDLYHPKEVALVSQKLGIHLNNRNKEDDKNMPLYAEVSLWLKTPYRYGGQTKRGADCSGFTYEVFKKIYRKKIPRSTAELSKAKQKKVSKRQLKTGDLVYFATSKNKKRINHVGIYLKENKFIHASTSSGVIVSNLNEAYYKKTWKKAGRL